ncbi:unnamed protein product [Clonostachys rosea f. rosea IK726]|uniref:Uncharacterized protein n=1 Tax=Clonostachys rosea f. rosea IK726 TaxID=1349383 RepID=A0ACA9USV9_BIOOC|nr:unnamed protein product [Clonostachys rosea f. rosea IK726]
MKVSVIFFGTMVQLKLHWNFILCSDNYPASCRLYTSVYHDRDHLPSAWAVRAAAGRDYHGYGELSSNHILRSSYSDAASGLYTTMYHNGYDFPRGSKHIV